MSFIMLHRFLIQLVVLSLLLAVIISPIYGELDYRALQAAVVRIQVDRNSTPGAGCVIKIEGKRGYILTAYHVIQKAVEEGRPRVEIKFHETFGTFEAFINEDWLQVENDLAVLVVTDMPTQDLLPLGSTQGLRVQDAVTAIGHPSGLSWVVTDGRVSRFTGRDIIVSGGAVDRGNSGGPLLDTQGQLVGMNIQDLGKFGIAIQIDVIKPILNRWIGPLSTAVPTTAQTPTAPARLPQKKEPMPSVIRGQDGKEMALVPAGWFEMGSTEAETETAFQSAKKAYPNTEKSWFEGEQPRHRVWLDGFYMDKHEVTVGEYKAFIQATGHEGLPDSVSTYAPGDNYPVVSVSWEDAKSYCEWSGKTLPTEAEWEKAARGEDRRLYPWGNAEVDGSRANYCDARCNQSWRDEKANDGYGYTSPVGSYEHGVSPYGIYDLAGNVWEWVHDWYEEGYYGRSPDRNPVNEQQGEYRVLRGGSWNFHPAYLRAASRLWLAPASRCDGLGFRCVLASAAPRR